VGEVKTLLEALLVAIIQGLIVIVPMGFGMAVLWLKSRSNHLSAMKAIAENTELTVKAAAVVVQTAEADGGKGTPVVAEAKQAIHESVVKQNGGIT
jgi:hypothetical protein